MVCIKPHNRGFTLVELIVTMVLIGILAAVAIPRMFNAPAVRSRGFFDEVVNAARYGQKLAVASGCNVELRIAGGGYALNQAQNCSSGPFNRPVPEPAGGGVFTEAAPPGVVLFATAPAVVFDSQGQATPGGVTVTVDGRNFIIVGPSGYVDGL
jgi:MSHA pilin protein MshC